MAQIHPVGEQLLNHRYSNGWRYPLDDMAKMAMAFSSMPRGPHQKPVVTIIPRIQRSGR